MNLLDLVTSAKVLETMISRIAPDANQAELDAIVSTGENLRSSFDEAVKKSTGAMQNRLMYAHDKFDWALRDIREHETNGPAQASAKSMVNALDEAVRIQKDEEEHQADMAGEIKASITDQPPPKPNDGLLVWNLVISDMQERDKIGRERYGTPLQTNNGRDALVDAYQEVLDQAVYLRQAVTEKHKHPRVYGEKWMDKFGRLWTYVLFYNDHVQSKIGQPAYVFEDETKNLRVSVVGSDISSWAYSPEPVPHRAALVEEVARLKAREQELLDANTRLVNELRAVDHERMVREFQVVVLENVLPDRPTIPEEKTIRLWCNMLLEEAIETIEACFVESKIEPWHLTRLKEEATWVTKNCPVSVRLPEAIDGTVDTDYISEGFRQVFGVKSQGVWAEVQRSNMAKKDGPRNEMGKKLKPEGWMPPDIEGELVRQGWVKP